MKIYLYKTFVQIVKNNMNNKFDIKKLGEICFIVKGKKPVLYKKQTSLMLPYLGARFMRGSSDSEFASIEDKSSVIISKKDLIIICDGSKSGDIFSGFEGILSSTMGKISFDENVVYSKYLKYFLDLNYNLFNNSKKGAAIPHLDFNIFKNLKISLPSLSIQRQIVETLDQKLIKLNKIKKLQTESVFDIEKILSKRIYEIFEAGKIKYTNTTFGEVATLVRGPFGGSLKKDIFVSKGDCVYEQGNVIDSDLENFRYFITPEKFNEMKRFVVSAGDILMSCSGTIGKFIIIPNIFKKGIINQALLKITPKKNIDVNYLKYALQDYLTSSTTHIKGAAIKNIASVKELKQFIISLPSITDQQKLVKELDTLVDKINRLKRLQKAQLEDFKKLEKAYLKEAFNGELI